jgi:Cdc25 family phosphatase
MVDYISPGAVHDLLKDSSARILIIDVRDEDFAGGHVESGGRTLNVPSEGWDDPAVLSEVKARCAGVQLCVFHCMMSSQRGPFCARAFHEMLSEEERNLQKVSVLQGGFKYWREFFPDAVSRAAGVPTVQSSSPEE